DVVATPTQAASMAIRRISRLVMCESPRLLERTYGVQRAQRARMTRMVHLDLDRRAVIPGAGQADRDGRRARILPIPAVNTGERRVETAGRLSATTLVVPHLERSLGVGVRTAIALAVKVLDDAG